MSISQMKMSYNMLSFTRLFKKTRIIIDIIKFLPNIMQKGFFLIVMYSVYNSEKPYP